MPKLPSRTNRVVVEQDNPFAGDLLGRRSQVEGVANLVTSFDTAHVLAIHGGWGSGKTTFVRMLRAHLLNRGFACIYFDAWSNDWATDPLLPLLASLEEQFTSGEIPGSGGRKVRGSLKATVAAGVKLAAASAPALLGAVAQAAVGKQVVEAGADALKSIAAAAPRVVEKAVEEILKSHKAQRSALDSFRRALSDFAEDWKDEEKGRLPPLVVVIDELDRCRPPFALALLERIKHAFGTDGVVFVLAVDRIQLGVSIRAEYGADIDAAGYLRRFVDTWYSLPEPGMEAFVDRMMKQVEFPSAVEGKSGGNIVQYNVQQALLLLVKARDVPLRNVERIIGQLDLAIRLEPRNRLVYPDLLVLFAVLRESNPEELEAFVNGAIGVDGILPLLRSERGDTAMIPAPDFDHLEAGLRLISGQDADRQVALDAAQFSGAAPTTESYLETKRRERLKTIGSMMQSWRGSMGVPDPRLRKYLWESLLLAGAFKG